MRGEKRQLAALSFCVCTVPCVMILPQCGVWVSAVALSAGAGIYFLADRRPPVRSDARLTALLVWNAVMLGAFTRLLSQAFVQGNALTGLLLLLAAAYAAGKGKKAVLRVGAVILLILIILYGMMLGLALPQARVVKKSVQWTELSAALTPMLCLHLRTNEENSPRIWVLATVLFGVMSALVTAEQSDFYAAMKSVSLYGVMQRLEPLVSVAVTLGGFCLLAGVCCVNESIISRIVPEGRRWASWGNFLFGVACFGITGILSEQVLAVGTAIFWGLLPFIPQPVEKLKK